MRDRDASLSFDEITRMVRLSAACGIKKVRLTGGEPLMCRDLKVLISRIAAISGIEDLSLTTNGILLAPMAADLKKAGLERVNISLDAVDRECYRRMTGFDGLPQALEGVRAALDTGLTPLKLNCVVMRHLNLSQVLPLADMTLDRPLAVRFIEYYPTTSITGPADEYVPNADVRAIMEAHFGAIPRAAVTDGGGPVECFRIPGALGTIGFISGRSSMFCDDCTRLRLTCDGRLKPCLHSDRSYDAGEFLRRGAGDREILELIRRVLQEKSRYNKTTSKAEDFLMQSIGG